MALAPAAFDRYVLALNIAGVLKALAKCAAPGDVRKAVRRYVAEKPDHRHRRLLRAGRGKIDWEFIDGEIVPLYSDQGRPGIETRFVIGLLLLKHIYGLSDEGVCERWV